MAGILAPLDFGRVGRFGLLAALALAGAVRSSAGTLYDAPGNGPTLIGNGFSLGSEFRDVATSTVLVTALGLYDVSGQTWDSSHEIGIWDVSTGNNLIADATVDNSGTLLNGFRYAQLVTPVALTDGDIYIIAAYYQPTSTSSDLLLDWTSTIHPVVDPNFLDLAAAYSGSNTLGSLTEPNFVQPTAYIGPNFQFQSGVPEPSSFALIAGGACLLIIARKVVRLRHRIQLTH